MSWTPSKPCSVPDAPGGPCEPQRLAQRRTATGIELDLAIQPELRYFAGHFPELPILPGVVLTDWAIRIAAETFGLPPRIAHLNRLKFQQVLRPNDRVTLTLEHHHDKHATDFNYRSASGPHASGRIGWR